MASNLEGVRTSVDVVKRLNPILRVILQGVYDKGSPLSLLRGVPELIKLIWNKVISYWKSYIKLPDGEKLNYARVKQGACYRFLDDIKHWEVEFPKPTGININMMPFFMEQSFDDCKLPANLKEYHENIIKTCQCIKYVNTPGGECEIGKIGYLTIHESFVNEDESQRRPGLHTESPGVALVGDSYGINEETGHWGRGEGDILRLYGGIYMASNVDNSCEIWDCKVQDVEDGPEVIGELGDCEHLREFLPKGEIMKKNIIYWLTDRTPHESLPLKKGTYRQFFRLVTSNFSLWYEDHSTKNPIGVVPDPKLTKIVKGSKFDKEGILLVDESNVKTV